MCVQTFTSNPNLIKHADTYHNEKRKINFAKLAATAEYVCQICFCSFENSQFLKLHAKNRRHVLTGKLQQTLNIEPTKKEFRCCMCIQYFSNANDLTQHGVAMHEKEARVNSVNLSETDDHVCQLCCRAFNSKDHLRRHLNYKSDEQREAEPQTKLVEQGKKQSLTLLISF
jgi:hypothetical protein